MGGKDYKKLNFIYMLLLKNLTTVQRRLTSRLYFSPIYFKCAFTPLTGVHKLKFLIFSCLAVPYSLLLLIFYFFILGLIVALQYIYIL